MSELYKIVLTSCLTIAGGLFVLLAGQTIGKLLIEPVYSARMAIGRVRYAMLFHANIYANPGTARPEFMDAASIALCTYAAELSAAADAVPWYRLFSFLRVVPRWKAIDDTVQALIGLSNLVYGSDHEGVEERREIIRRALG